MTKSQFLKELKKTPRGWYYTPKGAIRKRWWPTSDVDTCTLGAVRNLKQSGCRIPAEGLRVAAELGIRRGLALAIVRATDKLPLHDPALRAAIREACGLSTPLSAEGRG